MNYHYTTVKELYLCHYLCFFLGQLRGALNSRLVNIFSVVFSAKSVKTQADSNTLDLI